MTNDFPLGVYQLPAVGQQRYWGNLVNAAESLVIAHALTNSQGFGLIITPDAHTAEQVYHELEFFLANQSIPVMLFPDWETLIYDSFSPHQDIISERLAILNQLPTLDRGVLIAASTTVMKKLAPRNFLLDSSLVLDVGQKFNIHAMRERLQAAAYRCVETVLEHGEFAVRGSLMDIFPMGVAQPYRLDLFDDEIESIRIFDPETQLSLKKVSVVCLLPGKEFPLTTNAISQFQDRWHQHFQVDARNCPIYQDISAGISPAGVEYYLPLFFEQLETLFDYLPQASLIFTGNIEATMQQTWQDAEQRFENLRYDIQRPIFAPANLLLSPAQVFAHCNQAPRIIMSATETKGDNLAFPPLPEIAINERLQNPLSKLQKFYHDSKTKVLIATESNGRLEVVDELLRRHNLAPTQVDLWQSALATEASLLLVVAPIERGVLLLLPEQDMLLVSEQHLFGEHVLQQRRRNQQRDNAADLVIKNLTELNIGAPVVHIDHGVGRYMGLVTLTVDGYLTEFLCLNYRDEAKLYVPVASLHLISRYAGADENNAPLHRLGSETWDRAKRKAAKQVCDVAAELLNIYARREAKQGFAYPAPDESYAKFAATFPFEETPDQTTAISRVIADMKQHKAMDHLICGDVGFGKTEVAMRAAFIAVQAGKQVAVLVPTTLLAQQHTQTFKDRFAEWPMFIDSLSRFKTKKTQAAITQQIAVGTVDIVIGTHALIQDTIHFKNLGLLIIDEEHRFGVRQKEKLKSLRAEVDILTLTATPIPRTLNMAMSGMRDMTIIATPPAKRLAIKTFVRQHSDGLIKEAMQRELMRGGQVYYLHNEVKTIVNTAKKIQKIIPSARIGIGHGQMKERELERIMSDFHHQRINVLVCTTIIETGIDIPNANTIIMDRADKFGLAQTHQLRGRVGRSHHQAYAYLLTPHPKVLTADAKKRLKAISNAENLGAGFILATHDLEIRGAGELLGNEQTGNMQSIGFSLYMEMLNKAVNAIQNGKTPNLDRPLQTSTEINLHLPALIPEDYLPDVHSRLVLYKRISNADNSEKLQALQVEIIDRFGLLPEATKTLFRITSLKLQAERLGIKKIDANGQGGRLEFNQNPATNPTNIVRMVQSEPHRFQLSRKNQLTFTELMEQPETRFNKLEKLLQQLECKTLAYAS